MLVLVVGLFTLRSRAISASSPAGSIATYGISNWSRNVDTSRSSLWDQKGLIITVAGNGMGGFSGDGVAATRTSLHLPVRVIVADDGTLYISDYGNSRIRKIAPTTGIISTIAGGGNPGFGGDGADAINSSLYHPGGVVLDGVGNLYIADSDNHRIRMVEKSTGKIRTVAGNGSAGYNGDGREATSASLYYPAGVALDSSGNLYIADLFNNRVRKLEITTGRISTVAGDGSKGQGENNVAATSTPLQFPHGVAVDAAGNLFIAEEDNHRIRKVDAVTSRITTVAGNGTGGFNGDGGLATSASLYNPRDVAVDSAGNLYIADHRNSRIRRVDAASGIISTVAGNGTAWFSGDGEEATSASLYMPVGVALDSAGNLFIADTFNARIRAVRGVATLGSSPSHNSLLTPAKDSLNGGK